MKKTIFTLAAVAFLAVAGQAQDKSGKKEVAPSPTSSEVNPDGTLKQSGNQEAQPKKEEKKSGTRMAINEKGMPGNAAKKEHSSSSSSTSSSPKKD